MLVLLAYRPVLLFFGDSLLYLQHGVDLQLDKYRPSLYSLFLAPLLPLHKLWVVPAVQHLMGLAIGLALYALLRRSGIGALGATIGALPALFDGYQLNLEQFLMAETLFQALVVAAVVALVWPARSTGPGFLRAALAGCLLGAAALTRSVGLILIVPFVGYVLICRLGLRRAAVLAVSFTVPLAGYAMVYRAQTGHAALSSYDGHFLYARVAPFADCRGLDAGDLRLLCPAGVPDDRPNAMWYLWSPSSPAHVLERISEPSFVERSDGVLRGFAVRLIAHRPAAYASSIGDFLLRYLRGDPSDDGRLGQRTSTWEFGSSDSFPKETNPVLRDYETPGSRLRVHAGLALVLRAYQRVVHVPGPVLALAALLGIAGSVGAARGLGSDARAEALLLCSCGLLLVVGAAALSAIDYRYLLPCLPLLPPAGVIGATVLAHRVGFPNRAPATTPQPARSYP